MTLERLAAYALQHDPAYVRIEADCVLVASHCSTLDESGQAWPCTMIDRVRSFSELRAVLGY